MSGTIFLGTQGWSYKNWVGNFYPEGTRRADYLVEYAKHLRAVEIGSTCYGTPPPSTIKAWYQATPPDFRFTAKFPQIITHQNKLKNVERETAQFLATMHLLGEKLGPLVLQFPSDFGPDNLNRLAGFLAALPTDFRYAVKVRHRGWLTDEFFDLLSRHQVALVLEDYARMPRSYRVTTDFSYIHWLGHRSEAPDSEDDGTRRDRDAALDDWSDLIKSLRAQNISVWGFANNHYQGHSPSTIRALMQRLGLSERVPVRVEQKADSLDSERRATPRVSATYRIAYECFNTRGIKVDEGPARTVDISGRGALVEIPRGVDLDASMVLLVMAPFHMVVVKGSVVHSRATSNGAYHVGVRLTEVIEGTWDLVDQAMKEQMMRRVQWPETGAANEGR